MATVSESEVKMDKQIAVLLQPNVGPEIRVGESQAKAGVARVGNARRGAQEVGCQAGKSSAGCASVKGMHHPKLPRSRSVGSPPPPPTFRDLEGVYPELCGSQQQNSPLWSITNRGEIASKGLVNL